MTKTTEELKREMYMALAELKGRIGINYSIKDMLRGVDEFEHDLEDYLESLIHLRNCYERLACDYTTKSVDLKKQLVAMTANRDELARSNLAGNSAYSQLRQDHDNLRNRLQAFEFANKSAAELLSEALREPSELRKTEGSTSHQTFLVKASGLKQGGKSSHSACKHMLAYPGAPDCPTCGALI